MSLKEYIRKRDFKNTREPAGNGKLVGKGHRFVIQKHAASRMHYDFRLELDGTLKSWAVPKGVPYAKGEKRLAVQVEDHPVSYINFEGTIPKGQYGGGTVMVWDNGTFTAQTSTPVHDLADGKLHFELAGQKLHGEWYLVRLRDGKQWLLIRGGENMRPVSKKMEDTSALSGMTMKQLSESDQVWQSKPREEPAKGRLSNRRGSQPRAKIAGAAKTARLKKNGRPLTFVEPMKARLVENPPPGEWFYEMKFDGFRGLALKEDGDVQLLSRNEKDFSSRFPEVTAAIGDLRAERAIVDGEIVALDSAGRSSFQLLQAYELGEERPPIYYYTFDLLHLDGEDLQGLPVIKRKEMLEQLLEDTRGVIRYSASLGDDAHMLLKKVKALRLEGLIGKRKDSRYEPGRRSGSWIKLKISSEQEFVIGGYSDPEGGRKHFGALLAGYYDGKKLMFAGKVGTGFDQLRLRSLSETFEGIESAECPFANLPEKKRSRYSPGLTAAEMRRCHWLKPNLVCQIRFSEWTRDGKLRQPVFLGLRDDKNPREVVREKAA